MRVYASTILLLCFIAQVLSTDWQDEIRSKQRLDVDSLAGNYLNYIKERRLETDTPAVSQCYDNVLEAIAEAKLLSEKFVEEVFEEAETQESAEIYVNIISQSIAAKLSRAYDDELPECLENARQNSL